MLLPDTILQNRYRVMRQLGAGGMGAIYEALDQRVSCMVVIKETLVGPNSDARQAFQREAALLANLRHASLPKVMDYFGEANGEFLVMEFIPGNDLAELLEQRSGPFPLEQVLTWAYQLLNLLEYLHTREPPIVHRDIKPANLKLTGDGEIFLLDFGLAKGAAGQMATMRADGSVYGYTPLYAPLEQIHGQGTDPRTDIYSLGATLYDLLAGQPPVSAPVRFESIENERPDPLPLLNKLNSRVTPAIAEIIQKAMAMSRRNRFQSAAEMRAAIDHAGTAAAAEKLLKDDSPEVVPDRPLVTDDNVQFTVYTPRRIKPKKTYTMLAFAHLAKKRADAPADEPDPIAAMKDQAARILGDQQADYDDTKDEGSQPVPREGELLFVPLAKGITFSPPSRSFTWRESVHREEFELRTSSDIDGQTVSGTLTVFLGSLVIAAVPLKIAIDSRAEPAAEKVALDAPHTGRRVRQIYASYSPQDEKIVNELAQVAPIFGSRFVLDRTHLEPGEDRQEGLQRLIRGADVFQLFWSTNSMRSDDTANEIDYATSLSRPGFILPTYWEEPLPKDAAAGLPPPEIARLQFHRIYPGAFSSSTAEPRKSRLIILAPAGSEVFLNDERRGSMGSSGRLVVSSVPAGQHVLRIVCSGYRDDERVIEVREGGGEQTFLGRFKSRDRIGAAPVDESSAFAMAPSEQSAAPNIVPDDRQNAVPTGELPPIRIPETRAAVFQSAVPQTPKSRIVVLAPEGSAVFIDDEHRGTIGSSGRLVLTSISPGRHVLRIERAGYADDDERLIEVKPEGEEQIIQAQLRRDRAQTMEAAPAAGPADSSPATLSPQPLIAECSRCGSRFAYGTKICGRCGSKSLRALGDQAATFPARGERHQTAPTGELAPIQSDRDTQPLETPSELLPTPPVQAARNTIPSQDHSPMFSPMSPTQPPPAPTAYAAAPSQSQVVVREVSMTPPVPAMPAARARGKILLPIFAGVAMVLFVVIVGPVWYMMSQKSSSLATAPLNSNKIANRNVNSTASANSNSSSNGLPNAAGIAFVYIRPGTFTMGSNTETDEKPPHDVTIRNGFYMGKYEVTQAQWLSEMVLNPSKLHDCSSCPVENVSWDDAQRFIDALNRLHDGFKYRLPTEAEWEYACRAGTTGDYAGNVDSMAWYKQNSGGKVHEVGQLSPNAFGLFDMHGNVMEWCEDIFHLGYQDAPTNGSAWLRADQTTRVFRGGTAVSPANEVRSSRRAAQDSDYHSDWVGFRVVAVR